jgi:hypothetical protein
LVALHLILLPFLLQGCLGSTRYLAYPRAQTSVYTDIWNFSDHEITADQVDALYRRVARLMAITPEHSKPRPQVLVASPAYIQEKYLTIHPLAATRGGTALAVYIPHQNQILIPDFDRTLLTHELAHYFTFHYLSVPRSDWEAIADKAVAAEGSGD